MATGLSQIPKVPGLSTDKEEVQATHLPSTDKEQVKVEQKSEKLHVVNFVPNLIALDS